MLRCAGAGVERVKIVVRSTKKSWNDCKGLLEEVTLKDSIIKSRYMATRTTAWWR